MKIIYKLILPVLFLSCNHKVLKPDDISKRYLIDCKKELVCYSFLYNNDYAVALTEKTFWGYGKEDNEFVYTKLSSSYGVILKSVKTFEKKESLKQFYYKYAYVNDCKDTLYSDYTLKKWIVKVDGKSYFYEYDSSQTKADTMNTLGLRLYDNFFR